MSAAHTRDPWVITFRNDSSCYISMGSGAGEHKQFDLALDARYPSDVADARLIAAAPCLLEALREAVRSEVKGRALLEKCEAAIAKATGEGA